MLTCVCSVIDHWWQSQFWLKYCRSWNNTLGKVPVGVNAKGHIRILPERSVSDSKWRWKLVSFVILFSLRPLSPHWNIGRPPEISIFPCPWPFFPVGSNSSQSVLLQPQLIFSMLFSAVLGSFYPEVSIEGHAWWHWQRAFSVYGLASAISFS